MTATLCPQVVMSNDITIINSVYLLVVVTFTRNSREVRRKYWWCLTVYSAGATLITFIWNIPGADVLGFRETAWTDVLGLRKFYDVSGSDNDITGNYDEFRRLWPTQILVHVFILAACTLQTSVYSTTILSEGGTSSSADGGVKPFRVDMLGKFMLWFSRYGIIINYTTFLFSALSFERGEDSNTVTLVGVLDLCLFSLLVGSYLHSISPTTGGQQILDLNPRRQVLLWQMIVWVEGTILVARYIFQFEAVASYMTDLWRPFDCDGTGSNGQFPNGRLCLTLAELGFTRYVAVGTNGVNLRFISFLPLIISTYMNLLQKNSFEFALQFREHEERQRQQQEQQERQRLFEQTERGDFSSASSASSESSSGGSKRRIRRSSKVRERDGGSMIGFMIGEQEEKEEEESGWGVEQEDEEAQQQEEAEERVQAAAGRQGQTGGSNGDGGDGVRTAEGSKGPLSFIVDWLSRQISWSLVSDFISLTKMGLYFLSPSLLMVLALRQAFETVPETEPRFGELFPGSCSDAGSTPPSDDGCLRGRCGCGSAIGAITNANGVDMIGSINVWILLMYLPLHNKHIHVWIPLYWSSICCMIFKYSFQLSTFAPSCKWYSCCTPDAKWVGLARMDNQWYQLWRLVQPHLLVMVGAAVAAYARGLGSDVKQCALDDAKLLVAYHRQHEQRREETLLASMGRDGDDGGDTHAAKTEGETAAAGSAAEAPARRLPSQPSTPASVQKSYTLPADHSLVYKPSAVPRQRTGDEQADEKTAVCTPFEFQLHFFLANFRNFFRVHAVSFSLVAASLSLVQAAYQRMNFLSLVYILAVGATLQPKVGKGAGAALVRSRGWALLLLLWLLLFVQYFRLLLFPPSISRALGFELYNTFPWSLLAKVPRWACQPHCDNGANGTSCCTFPAAASGSLRLPMPSCGQQYEWYFGLGELQLGVFTWELLAGLFFVWYLRLVLPAGTKVWGARTQDRQQSETSDIVLLMTRHNEEEAFVPLLKQSNQQDDFNGGADGAGHDGGHASEPTSIFAALERINSAPPISGDANDFGSPSNATAWHLLCWLVMNHAVKLGLILVFLQASYKADVTSGIYMTITLAFLYCSNVLNEHGNRLFMLLAVYNWVALLLQVAVQIPIIQLAPVDPFCPAGARGCVSVGSIFGLFPANQAYFKAFIEGQEQCRDPTTRNRYQSCVTGLLFPDVQVTMSIITFVFCAVQCKLFASNAYMVYVAGTSRRQLRMVQAKHRERANQLLVEQRRVRWSMMAHAKHAYLLKLKNILKNVVRRIDEGFNSTDRSGSDNPPTELRVLWTTPHTVSLCWCPPQELELSNVTSYKLFIFGGAASEGTLYGSEFGEVQYIPAKDVATIAISRDSGKNDLQSVNEQGKGQQGVESRTYCQALVPGLQPGTEYRFQLLAIGITGAGAQSEQAVTCRTKVLLTECNGWAQVSESEAFLNGAVRWPVVSFYEMQFYELLDESVGAEPQLLIRAAPEVIPVEVVDMFDLQAIQHQQKQQLLSLDQRQGGEQGTQEELPQRSVLDTAADLGVRSKTKTGEVEDILCERYGQKRRASAQAFRWPVRRRGVVPGFLRNVLGGSGAESARTASVSAAAAASSPVPIDVGEKKEEEKEGGQGSEGEACGTLVDEKPADVTDESSGLSRIVLDDVICLSQHGGAVIEITMQVSLAI
jgi:hypothetical protein